LTELHNQMTPSQRLAALGIDLLPPPAPVASFINVVRVGPLLFLSGHTAWLNQTGGLVGQDVTVEQAYENARAVGLSLLSALKETIGSLDRVKRVVKVNGMVRAIADFEFHPEVIDGCSHLLVQVFGNNGQHARTAIGVGSLPRRAPVEIEAIFEILDD
jgi:enamine deaminase RidA (YjgF/YER057c/UK114 family)